MINLSQEINSRKKQTNNDLDKYHMENFITDIRQSAKADVT